jgi:hypothetical protein
MKIPLLPSPWHAFRTLNIQMIDTFLKTKHCIFDILLLDGCENLHYIFHFRSNILAVLTISALPNAPASRTAVGEPSERW